MDGKGHLIFAPVFTCLTTSLVTSSGIVPLIADDLTLTVVTTMAVSFASAKLADADQIALKPRAIITGTAKKRYSKRYNKEYYYVVISENEFIKKYGKGELKKQSEGKGDVLCERSKTGKYLIYYEKAGTKNKLMLMFALMFQTMRLKKHRGWQSHSPLLWTALAWLLCTVVYALPDIGIYFGTVALGLSAGYLSHIAGDMFTKEGVEILPDFFGAFVKILPKGMQKKVKKSKVGKGVDVVSGAKLQPMKYIPFAKSGSMVWTYILCFVLINIFAYIFMPMFFQSFWSFVLALLSQLWAFVKVLLIKLKDLFVGLMGG